MLVEALLDWPHAWKEFLCTIDGAYVQPFHTQVGCTEYSSRLKP